MPAIHWQSSLIPLAIPSSLARSTETSGPQPLREAYSPEAITPRFLCSNTQIKPPIAPALPMLVLKGYQSERRPLLGPPTFVDRPVEGG